VNHEGKMFLGLTITKYLDDWLTVHRNITLVNFQLDAQNSLFIYLSI